MKKSVLLVLTILISVSYFVCAQSHMNFMGMELNGSLTDIVSQMELKGFKVFDTDEHSVSMLGRHHGLTVVAEVAAAPISDTVYKVIIKYPTNAALWSSLYMDYVAIRAEIEKIYGRPTEAMERFEPPYSENNKPFEALREGKATYVAKYITDGGSIIVQLRYAEPCHEVQTIYWDHINKELYIKESEMLNN